MSNLILSPSDLPHATEECTPTAQRAPRGSAMQPTSSLSRGGDASGMRPPTPCPNSWRECGRPPRVPIHGVNAAAHPVSQFMT
eukprot:4585595-Prymnesium_polylepis.1